MLILRNQFIFLIHLFEIIQAGWNSARFDQLLLRREWLPILDQDCPRIGSSGQGASHPQSLSYRSLPSIRGEPCRADPGVYERIGFLGNPTGSVPLHAVLHYDGDQTSDAVNGG